MFCPNYSLTNAASVLEGEQSLVTADGLEQHKVVHINERPFERVDCGNTSKRESELFLHQRDTHSQGKPHRSNSQNCTKAYKRRHTLLAHQGKHKGKKRWFKSDELVKHKKICAHRKCDHCGQTFSVREYEKHDCAYRKCGKRFLLGISEARLQL